MKVDSNHYAFLVMRLTAGIALIAHSLYLKIFVFTLPGTIQFFESIGLPGPLAWITLMAEIASGFMLIIGYKVRYAAVGAIPFLIGATWAHSGNGWLFSNTGGGWEYPLFWTMTLIAIALMDQSTRQLRS